MDFWIADEALPALERSAADETTADRAAALVALAWAVRQRDSARAGRLLDQAQALLDPMPASPGSVQASRIRAALTRCELALLYGYPDEAPTWLDQARSLLPCPGEPELEGDLLITQALVARAGAQKLGEMQAYQAGLAVFERLHSPRRAELVRAMMAIEEITGGKRSYPLAALTEADGPGAPAGDADCQALWACAHALAQYRVDPARSAELYVAASERALRMGMVRLSVVCTLNAGMALQGLADFDGAAACYDEADEMARRSGWPPLAGVCRSCIGRLLRELGQLPASRAVLDTAVQAFASTPLDANAITAYSELAHTLLAMGCAREAIAPIDIAIARHRQVNNPSSLSLCLTVRGRILSAADEPGLALAAIEEASALIRNKGFTVLAVAVSDALSELHRRHPLPAPPNMTAPTAAVHYAEATLRDGLQIKGWKAPSSLYVGLAQVWAEAGRHEQAYAYACQALAAKESESTLRHSNPLALLRMLRGDDLEARPPVDGAAVPAPESTPAPRRQRLSAKLLSPKEREVLRLLERGCSNKEIAQSLEVGGETVKSHLKSIYAKLQAGSRRHAVNRARSLGMIHGEADAP